MRSIHFRRSRMSLLITGDAEVDADAAVTRGNAVGEAVNWARVIGH